MAKQFQSNMQQAISLFQQKIPVGLGLQNGDEMGLVLWGISPILDKSGGVKLWRIA